MDDKIDAVQRQVSEFEELAQEIESARDLLTSFTPLIQQATDAQDEMTRLESDTGELADYLKKATEKIRGIEGRIEGAYTDWESLFRDDMMNPRIEGDIQLVQGFLSDAGLNDVRDLGSDLKIIQNRIENWLVASTKAIDACLRIVTLLVERFPQVVEETVEYRLEYGVDGLPEEYVERRDRILRKEAEVLEREVNVGYRERDVKEREDRVRSRERIVANFKRYAKRELDEVKEEIIRNKEDAIKERVEEASAESIEQLQESFREREAEYLEKIARRDDALEKAKKVVEGLAQEQEKMVSRDTHRPKIQPPKSYAELKEHIFMSLHLHEKRGTIHYFKAGDVSQQLNEKYPWAEFVVKLRKEDGSRVWNKSPVRTLEGVLYDMAKNPPEGKKHPYLVRPPSNYTEYRPNPRFIEENREWVKNYLDSWRGAI